ncbi:MAG: phosphoesterase [Acidobacteria bacterium]|nr:phosphoesterase [Acidobacteriota bacterium]
MSWPEPIRSALALRTGASFYKCALQVNPHHYSASFRGQTHGMDETAYVEGILVKCEELDIHVIAITDHNSVAGVDRFREEGRKRGVHVLPGFEAASHEGVHVLCIYSPDTPIEKLARYLGELGIVDVDPSAGLSTKSLSDLLACVRTQGGITIAAHVTQDKGLLSILHGQPRINAWKDRNLLAVQIPGSVDEAPEDKKPIITNQNSDYRRDPAAGSRLAIAVVNAKDVAQPADLNDPSATCWIKMSDISVEGLRQAFLDPESRIRLNSDPPPDQHTELAALAWQGGFLDGAAVHFNENLNVLIGGRGAGKSTVVESLRYALAMDPLGEDARKAHEGIVRQVLKSGTKVSLLVRSYRPIKREYLIERSVPNPPVVRDESGAVLSISPLDLVAGLEVYGQHEISELTKNPEKRTSLLARFTESDPALEQRKDELKRELERSRSRILEVRKELKQVAEQLGTLPGLEELLKRFQEAGLEERLKEQSLLVREERIMKTAAERIAPVRQWLEQLRRNIPIDRALLTDKALDGLPGKQTLLLADTVLESFNTDVERAAKQMEEAIDRADKGLGEVRARWESHKKEVQAAYEKTLRDLQKSKVDGEEFLRLRRQIEDLRPLKERDMALRRDEKEHESKRRNLLAEWEDLKAKQFRELERAAKKVGRQLADRVRVRVVFAGNREPLYVLLRQAGGRLSEAIDVLRRRDSISLSEFVEACRLGKDSLAQKFGLPPAQADRIVQADPALIMQIEELDLVHTTMMELNVSPEGLSACWQSLDDLSTGQKATAVLLLLLLESDAPLIVDQPEDDLDNRFITDGVVPKMREEKRRRQFVFATHNANIPVLGDAELIIGLSAAGEASRDEGKAEIPVSHMGSIDSSPVRELVEELLEGGKDAFERRRLKYGF